MIRVELENSTIWVKQGSEFFINVINLGTEELYCTDEIFSPKAREEKKEYITISSLQIAPVIGVEAEALVKDVKDLKFDIVHQESDSLEENRYQPWTCAYNSGSNSWELKAKSGVAHLAPGSYLYIRITISSDDFSEGYGVINYRFRNYRIYDYKNIEGVLQEEEHQLLIAKVSTPDIIFAPKAKNYPYKKETEFEWKIKNAANSQNLSIIIDGKDVTNEELKGEISLFMGDAPHILEVKNNRNRLALEKKFWPAWFELKKVASIKHIPEFENQVTLWWNIPECSECLVQGEKKDKTINQEWAYTITDSDDFQLSYYDEEKFEKKLKISYAKPSFEDVKAVAISGFISPEEIQKSEACVNGIYGGVDPWTPEVKYVSLSINCRCQEGDCYIRINGSNLFTIKKEEQGKAFTVSVPKKESNIYNIELWDCYGCKVRKEIKK